MQLLYISLNKLSMINNKKASNRCARAQTHTQTNQKLNRKQHPHPALPIFVSVTISSDKGNDKTSVFPVILSVSVLRSGGRNTRRNRQPRQGAVCSPHRKQGSGWEPRLPVLCPSLPDQPPISSGAQDGAPCGHAQ